MSKTPYELRYDLLAMAQSIETERIMNDRIRLENDWGLEREKASIRLSNGETDVSLPPFPKMPELNEEKIIRLAKRLNEFVSNNGE